MREREGREGGGLKSEGVGQPPLTAACFLSSRVGRSIPHAALSITPLSSHRYWFTVPPRASTHSWHAAKARR